MLSLVLSRLVGWLGWRSTVLVVQRADGGASVVTLPGDLPVSIRPNTDGSVGITVGHDDDGEALLADLRALMDGGEQPVSVDTRTCRRA